MNEDLGKQDFPTDNNLLRSPPEFEFWAAMDSQIRKIKSLKFLSPQISFKTFHLPALQPDRSLPFQKAGAGAGMEPFDLNPTVPDFPSGGKIFDSDAQGGDVRPGIGKLKRPPKVWLVPGSIGDEIQVQVPPGFFHHSREYRRQQALFLRPALQGNPQEAGRVNPGGNAGGKGSLLSGSRNHSGRRKPPPEFPLPARQNPGPPG